jgi:hypothetical protein
MTSLSNRQTLPIRTEGIFPSLHNLHIVIWCNLKYVAISLVVIICANIDSPVWSLTLEKVLPTPGKSLSNFISRTLASRRPTTRMPVVIGAARGTRLQLEMTRPRGPYILSSTSRLAHSSASPLSACFSPGMVAQPCFCT